MPADRLLAAVRAFAEQEFADRHRYALALHTDELHPQVHLVIKAMTVDCVHLNIGKATLRWWRDEFASHLRDQGIPAKGYSPDSAPANPRHQAQGHLQADQPQTEFTLPSPPPVQK